MENDSDQSSAKPELSYKGKNSAELRERRRKAGVIQVGYFIRDVDKAAAAKAIRDYTDIGWLALYEAGAVHNGANETRADDIRRRLNITGKVADWPGKPDKGQ